MLSIERMLMKWSRAISRAPAQPASSRARCHASKPRNDASRSLCSVPYTFLRSASASSRLSSGETKGERVLIAAAIVSTGSRHPIRAPKTSIFPMRGSTGSSARWLPSGVSDCSADSAPSVVSSATAASTAAASGGSTARARNSRGSAWSPLSSLSCSVSASSGTRSISGCWYSAKSLSCLWRE